MTSDGFYWAHLDGEDVVVRVRNMVVDDDGVEVRMPVVHVPGQDDARTVDDVVLGRKVQRTKALSPRQDSQAIREGIIAFFLDRANEESWHVMQQVWHPDNFAAFQRGNAKCLPVPASVRAHLKRLAAEGVLLMRPFLQGPSGHVSLYEYARGPKFHEAV